MSAGACDVVIARNPDAAAGHRAGAAVLVGLLDDDRRQAVAFRAQRGGHAAAAGADDDDVELLVPAHRNTSVLSRSEEHTSELQSLMRISYAVFCLKKKT